MWERRDSKEFLHFRGQVDQSGCYVIQKDDLGIPVGHFYLKSDVRSRGVGKVVSAL